MVFPLVTELLLNDERLFILILNFRNVVKVEKV